jgi:lipoprotein-anchoring transpeptidase ErfK/SrfK
VQTLKTAVVVVLFLTVLYSAYVALDTPEKPLPGELMTMMKEVDDINPEALEEDINFDDSDASSNLESASGSVPTASVAPPSRRVADLDVNDLDIEAPSSSSGSSSPRTKPASTPLAPPPLPGSNRIASNGGSANPLSDDDRSARLSDIARPLPPAGSAAPPAQRDENRQYPATERSAPPNFDRALKNVPSLDVDTSETAALEDVDLPPPSSDRSGMSSDAIPAEGDRAMAAGFDNALKLADDQTRKGELREALATLSIYYGSPDLPTPQREELLRRLDPLAGEVIYSRGHHLEQPYRVGRNERLSDIAKQFNVPAPLLANINGVTDPDVILPGTELKVVRGPFRADIDLTGKELTLFLNDLYAGRFPIEVGSDPTPTPGEYQVLDKQPGRTYYGAGGQTIEVGAPQNPYGNVWLDLGRNMCIHGTAAQVNGLAAGCIRLRDAEASDVFGILSNGSAVLIR